MAIIQGYNNTQTNNDEDNELPSNKGINKYKTSVDNPFISSTNNI